MLAVNGHKKQAVQSKKAVSLFDCVLSLFVVGKLSFPRGAVPDPAPPHKSQEPFHNLVTGCCTLVITLGIQNCLHTLQIHTHGQVGLKPMNSGHAALHCLLLPDTVSLHQLTLLAVHCRLGMAVMPLSLFFHVIWCPHNHIKNGKKELCGEWET